MTSFQCLYCLTRTPSAESKEETLRLAEDADWTVSKALGCPQCSQSIRDGTCVRPVLVTQLEMD